MDGVAPTSLSGNKAEWLGQNELKEEEEVYENAFLSAGVAGIDGLCCRAAGHDDNDNDNYARNCDYWSGQDSGA
jgi:hypothetical protein